jgi:predicted nucleotidyltransferase
MVTGLVQQAAGAATSGLVRAARDARGQPIDLSPLRLLLDRIVATWRPEQVWLFGSRARGEAQAHSDWDLFAVVPDDVPEEELGPLASWRLRKESRTRADILPCHASAFREDRETPNTMPYEIAREGILLYER